MSSVANHVEKKFNEHVSSLIMDMMQSTAGSVDDTNFRLRAGVFDPSVSILQVIAVIASNYPIFAERVDFYVRFCTATNKNQLAQSFREVISTPAPETTLVNSSNSRGPPPQTKPPPAGIPKVRYF
jgi:hypothetical protein